MNKIIKQLIDETMFYDFPFMASENKKREIIAEKKLRIETVYRTVFGDEFAEQELIDEVWSKAIKHTDECFASLSQNIKVNAFYLQELMHYYSEGLSTLLMTKNEEE